MSRSSRRKKPCYAASLTDQCPLCGYTDHPLFSADRRRPYYRCMRCSLVFVPRAFYVSECEEKAEYDLHNNDPNDPHYRQFLSRLTTPLIAQLPANATGLDFGCGPGPTLCHLMAEAGHSMALYDLFYYPDKACLNQQYDFITATEVVEHLHQPGAVMAQLFALLKTNGILAVMTKRVIDQAAFVNWHYKNDKTHVCFFSEQTFTWLAEQWGAELTITTADVVFLQKRV